MAGVTLKKVYKTYPGGITAVSDLNIEIEDKEFIIIAGPTGCGKTTILRIIAGLEEITKGELYIGDRFCNDVAPDDRDIAMVFSNNDLYPDMTVFENMAFCLELRQTPKEEIKRRVHEAAKILSIEHILDRKPKTLSAVQRQRVALGRAIVREPKLFLMDEPFSNLDEKLRVQMRRELSRLHQKLNKTFIYVTNDQTEALSMGTRIVVMKGGVIQQIDSPQKLYDEPVNTFVAGFIGSPQMNMASGLVEKQGDKVMLKFGRYSLELPENKAKMLEEQGYIGKEIIFGIRPEDVHVEEDWLKKSSDTLDSVVESVEPLGSEAYLNIILNDINFIARKSFKSAPDIGGMIKVAFDMTRIHIFDMETEKTIVY